MENKFELLFQPYTLNNRIELKNKIVMAPMTRCMANDDGTPTNDMAQYYSRRANAGLIITEGTIIRPDGRGHKNVPGIFSAAHIHGWQNVTRAVHEKEGKIFLQLWHVGRVSHPFFLDGKLPLSASETKMSGTLPRHRELQYGTSRAVTLDEIQTLILSYKLAAQNAIEAGFDGVEIHGANGYLIDQFLHYHTNHRQDDYGKTPENMSRFALAVVHACGEAIGYERVGLRLSPGGYLNEIVGDHRDAQVFSYLLEQLNRFSIAYVHTGNFDDSVIFPELHQLTMTQFIRKRYHHTLIACGSYSFEKAVEGILHQQFDLIAIGRPFIANPDLIIRLKNGQPLINYDVKMLNELN